MNYKVPSSAWAVSFQKLAREAGVTCDVKYLDQAAEDLLFVNYAAPQACQGG